MCFSQKFVKVEIECDDDESDDEGDVAPTPQECKMQGTKLFAQGDYEGAANRFSQAIVSLQSALLKEHVEDLVSCLNNRAACFLKLEKYEDARLDCDRVLERNPQNHKAFLRRATTFEKAGQLEKAFGDFQSALKISPNLEEAALAVERLSEQLKRSAATHATTEAIKFKDLGNTAFNEKKLEVALQHYTMSLSLDPNLSVAYCNRALIHIKLGKFKEAIVDCDKTLQLDEYNTKALYRRGLAFFELNDYRKALDMFERLISINPDNSQAIEQAKKVKDVLEKLPAPKISMVETVSASSPVASKTNQDRTASPLKKSTASPLKPVDTAKVAQVAKERIKTKLTNGKMSSAPKTAYEFENYWRTLKSDTAAFYNVSCFSALNANKAPSSKNSS